MFEWILYGHRAQGTAVSMLTKYGCLLLLHQRGDTNLSQCQNKKEELIYFYSYSNQTAFNTPIPEKKRSYRKDKEQSKATSLCAAKFY